MNRKIAPTIKDAIDYTLHLKPYEHLKLDNGISVYTVNAGAQEVIQLEIVFYAGNSFEQQRGIAAATNFLLKNGTSTKTALQINEAFEYYGGYCNRVCYNETAVISLHSLTKHVNKLLPILNEMLTDSIFSEEELKVYKQNAQQRLKVNLQKAEFVAGRLIDSYVYGEQHPYGVYTNPLDIENITTDACKQFYEKYYLNGSCIIFAAGNLPPQFINELNAVFGKLHVNKTSIKVPLADVFPAVEKKYRIENDPNAVQGAIR